MSLDSPCCCPWFLVSTYYYFLVMKKRRGLLTPYWHLHCVALCTFLLCLFVWTSTYSLPNVGLFYPRGGSYIGMGTGLISLLPLTAGCGGLCADSEKEKGRRNDLKKNNALPCSHALFDTWNPLSASSVFLFAVCATTHCPHTHLAFWWLVYFSFSTHTLWFGVPLGLGWSQPALHGFAWHGLSVNYLNMLHCIAMVVVVPIYPFCPSQHNSLLLLVSSFFFFFFPSTIQFLPGVGRFPFLRHHLPSPTIGRGEVRSHFA